MAVENVTVSSAVGLDGNTYTTAISNDKLTNDDFLKLMIEELKMQDPTQPMDSESMLNMQMQMSSIDTNLQMVSALTSMQTAINQSNLSNASNLIDKIIENGEYSDDGNLKQFMVSSVALADGEVLIGAYEILSYDTTTGEMGLATERSDIPMTSLTKISG